MKIIPFAAILLSALSAFPVFGNDEAGLQELFRRLDRAIAHSGEYAARREAVSTRSKTNWAAKNFRCARVST